MLTYGRGWSITEAHNAELTRLLEENGITEVGDGSGIYASSAGSYYYHIGDNGGEIYIQRVNDYESRVNLPYDMDIGYPSPKGLMMGILKVVRALEEGRNTYIFDAWLDWMSRYDEVGFSHFDFPEHGT